jgi:hypothetical protein
MVRVTSIVDVEIERLAATVTTAESIPLTGFLGALTTSAAGAASCSILLTYALDCVAVGSASAACALGLASPSLLVPARNPNILIEFDQDIITTFDDEPILKLGAFISKSVCDLTVV